jgi:hypothetical protein
MAKEMQDVNESRFNPARAIAASAPAARILVVEDEAALSMFLSYNLEAESFTVDRAILLENERAKRTTAKEFISASNSVARTYTQTPSNRPPAVAAHSLSQPHADIFPSSNATLGVWGGLQPSTSL